MPRGVYKRSPEHNKNLSEANLKSYKDDPTRSRRQGETIRSLCKTPESHRRRSEATRLMWKNPEYRELQMKAYKKPEYLRIRSEQNSGENNPQWRGGLSCEPYSLEFNKDMKEFIRMRDGYTCQLCGVPQTECSKGLFSHHIDYDKKNTIPPNLISLCASCNSRVNKNREYWVSYFQNRLNKLQTNRKTAMNLLLVR